MKNVFISREEHAIKADIAAIEDWEGFESLAGYLEQRFNTQVVRKIDGPESRIWWFEINNQPVQLRNNSYGNYLVIEDKRAEEIFFEIVNDLEERLSN